MGKKRKPFIDKKNAVTFKLVHRSQKDPLIVAEDSQHVLMPAGESAPSDPKKRREEQLKYGVYYDDEYDYLQHLRDVNEVVSLEPIVDRFQMTKEGDAQASGAFPLDKKPAKLIVPSTALESEYELETGMLNLAAPNPGPHPEWDPDIVAALDDDFDFDNPDNQLDDDFIHCANAGDEDLPSSSVLSTANLLAHDGGDDDGSNSDRSGSDADSEGDDVSSAGADVEDVYDFEQEETKSRFTEYSMSSSVVRRTEGLKLLDDMFEKLYEQYDEEDIGDMEDIAENIEGGIAPTSERIKELVAEYHRDKRKAKTLLASVFEEKGEMEPRDTEEGFASELVPISDDDQQAEKWDCESILSTYSTLYNHPTLIKEKRNPRAVKVNEHSGLPVGVLKGGLNRKGLEALDDQRSMASSRRSLASTCRPKDETSEQRKARKQIVKELRRERRVEKKANKLVFKSEELKQNTEHLNVQNNLAGLKLL